MLYDHATEMGLEGIVSKRIDAPYIETRSKTWVKVKAPLAGDFPIVGYTLSPAAGGIGAIALGAVDRRRTRVCAANAAPASRAPS